VRRRYVDNPDTGIQETMLKKKPYTNNTLLMLLVLSILAAGHSTCAAGTLDDCIRGLEQRYRAMQDLSARFEQETYIGSLKRAEKGAGMVYFKKGGKMYWEYTQPAVQKIYLDGKNLWFYLPEDNQVLKNDVSKLPSDITLDLFAGKLKIREKFNVQVVFGEAQEQKDTFVLKLSPKTAHPNLKSLTLWVDQKNYCITRSSLEDEIGNRTLLKFSAITIDKGLSDSLFMFTPPPGVEIYEPPSLSSPNPSP
jgi:outer membrane lipoprotein carrier protein